MRSSIQCVATQRRERIDSIDYRRSCYRLHNHAARMFDLIHRNKRSFLFARLQSSAAKLSLRISRQLSVYSQTLQQLLKSLNNACNIQLYYISVRKGLRPICWLSWICLAFSNSDNPVQNLWRGLSAVLPHACPKTREHRSKQLTFLCRLNEIPAKSCRLSASPGLQCHCPR